MTSKKTPSARLTPFAAVLGLLSTFGASGCAGAMAQFEAEMQQVATVYEGLQAQIPAMAQGTNGTPAQPGSQASGNMQVPAESWPTPPTEPAPNRARRVVLFDNGFNMAYSSVQVPAGWQVAQNISTNNEGITSLYVDYWGPKGELIRAVPTTTVLGALGHTFEGAVQARVAQAVGPLVDDYRLGGPVGAPRELQEIRARQWELPWQGVRGGKKVGGRVYVIQSMLGTSDVGTFDATVLACAPEDLEATQKTALAILGSQQMNPQYEQTVAQVRQQAQQGWNQQQEQRTAAFHQRMKDMDESHAKYMKSQFGSGSSSSSSSTDGFVGMIREESTFENPHTGQEVTLSNHFDNTYLDSSGNSIQTNDPSFNPNQVQGDFVQVAPR